LGKSIAYSEGEIFKIREIYPIAVLTHTSANGGIGIKKGM
jgi:hypothetical protein